MFIGNHGYKLKIIIEFISKLLAVFNKFEPKVRPIEQPLSKMYANYKIAPLISTAGGGIGGGANKAKH